MQEQHSGLNRYFTLALFCTLGSLLFATFYRLNIAHGNGVILATDDSVAVTNMDTLQYLLDQVNATDTASNLTYTSPSEKCNCDEDEWPVKFIRHGENSPLLVPDTLPPMEGDILDKIKNNKVDNTLLVTIAQSTEVTNDNSNDSIYEVYNWIRLLEASNEDKFLIFALDERLYLHLIVSGYEDKVVLVPDSWYMYGQPQHSINIDIVKPWILQRLLYIDANLLFLDIHSLLLKERTREYMQTLFNIRGDTKLIATPEKSYNQSIISTDLMLFRHDAKPLKRLMANVIQLQYSQPALTEQQVFNRALDQLDLHVKTGMLVLLDILHFPHHEDYFEKNLLTSKGVEPYLVKVGHKTDEKWRELLKEHILWRVDESSIDGTTRQVEDMLKRKYPNSNNEEPTVTTKYDEP